jgi:hypothetical protein
MGYIILAVIALFIILSLIKRLIKLAALIAVTYFVCIYFLGFNLQNLIGMLHL